MTSISIFDSHAYRGCRARIANAPRDETSWEATVAFDDGAHSEAVCEWLDEHRFHARVAPYVTNAGTPIEVKHWIFELEERRTGNARITGQIKKTSAARKGTRLRKRHRRTGMK